WGTEVASEGNQARFKEYESIMKAAKKCKRPVDVGSSDAEVKQAHLEHHEPSITLEQLEENVEITSVYFKPELTQSKQEAILSEIIEEFRLSENTEQEMSLKIISEHFIRGEVKQFLEVDAQGGRAHQGLTQGQEVGQIQEVEEDELREAGDYQ
ncbi:hypothetical protein BDR05DRAFT_954152, partial [Suillus weaverae]